jgi:hypothetical protein
MGYSKRTMMKERPAQVPAEIVIGISTTLLGVLSGVGVAFMLWSQLHHTSVPGVLTAAVVAMASGLIMVGFAVQSLSTRLFLIVAACSLTLAFFAGPLAFSTLIQ